jgi:hypothetical protein
MNISIKGGTLDSVGEDTRVYWSTPGVLEIDGIFFKDGVDNASTYGVYAENGRVTVHDCTFQKYGNGFASTINLTSGVYQGIVYGNIYGTDASHQNPAPANNATNPCLHVAGSIGIGCLNPSQMLEVGRSDHVGMASDGQIVVGKTDGSSSYRRFKIGLDSNYNLSIGDYSADGDTTYSPYITVHYSGSLLGGAVGIGQTSPTSGLHIGANAGSTDKGYITLEQLSGTPSAPGTGKCILYMRNGHLCTRVGTGAEVLLA